jgi:hypothetical protein
MSKYPCVYKKTKFDTINGADTADSMKSREMSFEGRTNQAAMPVMATTIIKGGSIRSDLWA